jgi:hypothetical protein
MIRDVEAGTARRFILIVASGVVAPSAGIRAATAFPNPPGNGPGVSQVLAGVFVPAAVVALAAFVVRARPAEAAAWALFALVATGGLLVLLMWIVFAATGGQ